MYFSFEDRLNWIYNDKYEFNNEVKVIETNESGKAEIIFTSVHKLMKICLSEDNRLKYLKRANVADGTICELYNDNNIDLHIIECKRSVNLGKWEKVKLQLEGGVLNSFALSGLLNKS